MKSLVGSGMVGCGLGEGAPRTLNSPPMMERMMMAKTDTTTLTRSRSQLCSCVRWVDGRLAVPTPGVEGGDDRFHGCGWWGWR